MDRSLSFNGAIDTFSNTFSSDQYLSSITQELGDAGPEPSRLHESESPTISSNQGDQPSSAPPGTAHSTQGLNLRSCVTCRKRKVRCDKKHPCSNCQRASIECIFPRPGRAPRRSKKPPDSELLNRLRRLEGVVESLGMSIDEENPNSENADPGEQKEIAEVIKYEETSLRKSVDATIDSGFSPTAKPPVKKFSTVGIEKEMGRLVVEDGRSRYVSNSLWAGLTQQIAEMRDILDDPTEEEDDYPTPDSSSSTTAVRQTHQAFLFGYSSAMITLRILHPPAKDIPVYWEIFKENVSPLVTMLHLGTTEQLVLKSKDNLDTLNKAAEALMFAIYFAVVTTVSEEQCQAQLSISRDIALRRFRFATEQALARAGFLDTQEIMVLQAFVLFLISVRRHDDSRFVWMMTALVTRMGNSSGLHRDGQQFGLLPFDTEMRRRLWWQIGTLDFRSAEDQGAEPTITIEHFDTKVPLNINDEDIWPDIKEPPAERKGWTNMTFELIRYEISIATKSMTYFGTDGAVKPESRRKLTLVEKEELIQNLKQSLESKYLKYCDGPEPLQFVAKTVARLIIAKLWLIAHQPFSHENWDEEISQDRKNKLFSTSLEVVSYSRQLETASESSKWGWMFRAHIQWHAVAFLLSELCTRTTGPEVDRAWQVLNGVFAEWGGIISTARKSMLWKPIRKLMAKARAARKKAFEDCNPCFTTDDFLGTPYTDMQVSDPSLIQPPVFPTPVAFNQNVFAPKAEFGNAPTNEVLLSALPLTTNPTDSNALDQWLVDDTTMLEDPLNGEENMNWAGWDDMVRNFQMETQQEQPAAFNLPAWW